MELDTALLDCGLCGTFFRSTSKCLLKASVLQFVQPRMCLGRQLNNFGPKFMKLWWVVWCTASQDSDVSVFPLQVFLVSRDKVPYFPGSSMYMWYSTFPSSAGNTGQATAVFPNILFLVCSLVSWWRFFALARTPLCPSPQLAAVLHGADHQGFPQWQQVLRVSGDEGSENPSHHLSSIFGWLCDMFLKDTVSVQPHSKIL